LTLASGAGAIGNRTIGTAAAGGMLIGTVIGVFLIPGLYVVFETIDTKLKERKARKMENATLTQEVHA
jgi:HAE1 family hydrophobic/amphiphilic exporter-1